MEIAVKELIEKQNLTAEAIDKLQQTPKTE